MDKYKKYVENIYEKAYEEGLTRKDYYNIASKISLLKFDKDESEMRRKVIFELEKIKLELKTKGVLEIISKNNIEFILKNSLLLPLVFANNGDNYVRFVGSESFRFLCQFHEEKTPSMNVHIIKEVIKCYSCDKRLKPLSYLREFEKLNFTDSLVIAGLVFGFEMPDNLKKLKHKKIAEKYVESIKSPEFKHLLDENYNRLQRKGVAYEEVKKAYKKEYDLIDRIKNNEFDYRYMHEDAEDKRLYLSFEKKKIG